MITKTKRLISWKACGFDLNDRKGSVGVKEEVQIHYSRGKYEVAFHHATKATLDDLDQAKQFAEEHILEWMEARAQERQAYETQRIAESRRAHEAQSRQTDLVNQLRSMGIDARDGIGIQISHEAAQELIRRLQGVEKQPQLVQALPKEEAALGSEMRILMAC
jgi:hypothetical protein